MVKYLFILTLFISIVCCKSNFKSTTNLVEEKPVRIANDSLEYELIIFDQGFTFFLNATAQPRGFFSQNTLENWNLFKVNIYNIRANQPILFGNLYPQKIEYDSSINYGYEVNYLLYNYFLFFEEKYNQKL